MRNLALVLALALVGAACGKKSDSAAGGKVASCNSVAMHSCREYRDGNLAAGSDSLAKLCTAIDNDATFTGEGCPTAGKIGTCKFEEGKDFFYEGYILAESVEADCKAKGATFAK